MRVRLILGWVIVLSLVAAIGYAQQPVAPRTDAAPALNPSAAPETPGRTLSLAEALETARRNSPDYLSTLNDRWATSARERSTLLNLITPTASVSAGARRTQSGTTVISGFANPVSSPANTSSSWNLSLNYALSGSTFANRGLASADARAVESDVAGSLVLLETTVRAEYLNLLQTIAQRDLAQRSLERSQENLNLAQARYSVGQGTLIDVRSAEVGKGQAAVNVLTARQAFDNQTLRLFQVMGVPAPDGVHVVPTDSFPVTEPSFNQADLIRMALDANPTLVSLRAREASARWNTRAARSQYFPSLNLSGSYGGYRLANDAGSQLIDTSNGACPSTCSINIASPASSQSGKNPFSVSAFVSVPIYDGFARSAQIQQARAAEDDSRLSIRRGELAVRAGVSAAYLALVVGYEKIGLQKANQGAAAEALDLATQRYRVGSGTYLELLDARLAADKADADYLTAIYDYQRAIATLENAVGRPLR